MALQSRQEIESHVDLLIGQYDYPQMRDLPADLHFEKLRAIYGEVLDGPPVDEQFANQGGVIAVLFYRLAQARGYVADDKPEKVRVGDNIYAQTPEQAEAVNHFIETGETMPGAGQAYL